MIETDKIHSIDLQAYLADILAKLVDGCPAHKLDELLPWTWAEQNRLATRPDCGPTPDSVWSHYR